eukprot:5432173-Amphidinium_carterae.1
MVPYVIILDGTVYSRSSVPDSLAVKWCQDDEDVLRCQPSGSGQATSSFGGSAPWQSSIPSILCEP